MLCYDVFGVIFGLAYGIFTGPISSGFVYLFLVTVIFEIYVFASTEYSKYSALSRILMNVAMVIGWIIGRYLYLGETGIDNLSDIFDVVIGKSDQ